MYVFYYYKIENYIESEKYSFSTSEGKEWNDENGTSQVKTYDGLCHHHALCILTNLVDND